MDQNINVTSSKVADVLAKFQAEMVKMQTLFEEVKKENAAAKNYWEGDDSDAMLSQIESFQGTFDSVKEKNEKYVAFLNSTIDSYSTTDKEISSKTTSSSLGINGS